MSRGSSAHEKGRPARRTFRTARISERRRGHTQPMEPKEDINNLLAIGVFESVLVEPSAGQS